MSNLPQQDTIQQFSADGITREYQITFFAPLESTGEPDINVYTQLSTAAPVPAADIKLWNTDYTYTPEPPAGKTGGTVTFNADKIPPSGYIVTIARNISASLNVAFSDATTFSGITLDAALDKLLLITQQNKSYALDRNLSYIVNSYLPAATIEANTKIPVLSAGQVWFGSANGVIAATLEQPADVSTLRSELANEQETTNGAALVGYYDSVNVNPTTVASQLTLLTNAVVAPFPTGSIIDFAGATPPAGFILCDGTSYPTATYPDLFDVIQYAWGGVDEDFNVPDLNGKVTAGSGGTLPPLGNSVGDTGGAATYALESANLPPHSHAFSYAYNGVAANAGAVSGYPINVNSTTIGSATGNGPGVSTAFTIVQPTAIVLKCIKT